MSLLEKLLKIQQETTEFTKDMEANGYKAVGSTQVLATIRPKMDELKLLLIPSVTDVKTTIEKTATGVMKPFTEINMNFKWIDTETGETMEVPWYAQGTDQGGERGAGKAYTYGEKYFLLKFFHVPTEKDDPDATKRRKDGQEKMRGTEAGRETNERMRLEIKQIAEELSKNNEERKEALIKALTEDKKNEYEGVKKIEEIKDAALGVILNKARNTYQKTTGKKYIFKEEE